MKRLLLLAPCLLLTTCCSRPRGSTNIAQILEEHWQVMASMKSYSATWYLSTTDTLNGDTVSYFREAIVSAQKPGKLRLKIWILPSLPPRPNGDQPFGPPHLDVASDGITDFVQYDKKYVKRAADPMDLQLGTSPLSEFFPGNPPPEHRIATSLPTFSGLSVVEGIPCDLIDVGQTLQNRGQTTNETDTVYMGIADHLIHRITTRSISGTDTNTTDVVVKIIDTNPVLNQSIFTYTPPPGAEETTGSQFRSNLGI